MSSPQSDRDILRWALRRLRTRVPDLIWAEDSSPKASLVAECMAFAVTQPFSVQLTATLAAEPWLHGTLDMLITYQSHAAQPFQNALGPSVPEAVAWRGWCLGRWLPTLLVLDGPLGRFLTSHKSPVAHSQGGAYPLLTSARALLGRDDFRFARNGLAHWSFAWNGDFITVFDAKYGKPPIKFHREELEAFYLVSYTLIDTACPILLRANEPRA